MTLSVNPSPRQPERAAVDFATVAAYEADTRLLLVRRLRAASLLALIPIVASAALSRLVFDTLVHERLVTHAVQAGICVLALVATLLDRTGTRGESCQRL